MKMYKKKKGSAVQTLVLIIVAVCSVAIVTGGTGLLMGWWSLPQEEQEQPTGIAPQSKSGDLATLKLSVKDDADNPARYAGTGYCWDVDSPNVLISGSSIALSASAGTTISPVTIGKTYECVAFDSSHLGVPKRITLKDEGEELILSSRNITGSATDYTFDIYEDGTKETAKSLTVPAGSTNKFDKFVLSSNSADDGFNLKEICLGSNSTSSEVSLIELGGLASTSAIPYALRNSADFCFTYGSPIFLRDYEDITVNTIKVTTTASFTHPENMTLYFLDEAQYKSVDSSIKLGVQDDTVTPATTGATDITSGEYSFLVKAS